MTNLRLKITKRSIFIHLNSTLLYYVLPSVSPRWLLLDLYLHSLLRAQPWRGRRGAGGAQRARNPVQLPPPPQWAPRRTGSYRCRWWEFFSTQEQKLNRLQNKIQTYYWPDYYWDVVIFLPNSANNNHRTFVDFTIRIVLSLPERGEDWGSPRRFPAIQVPSFHFLKHKNHSWKHKKTVN